MFWNKKLKADNERLRNLVASMNDDFNEEHSKLYDACLKLGNANTENDNLKLEIARLTGTQACMFFQEFINLDIVAIERRLNGNGFPVTNITYRFKDINELNIMAFHISIEEHNKLVNKFLPSKEES